MRKLQRILLVVLTMPLWVPVVIYLTVAFSISELNSNKTDEDIDI